MFGLNFPKNIAMVHLVAADVAAQEIGDIVLEGGGAQEFRLLHARQQEDVILFRIVKMYICGYCYVC